MLNRRLEASLQISWKKLAKEGEWVFPCYLWTKANPGCLTHPYNSGNLILVYVQESTKLLHISKWNASTNLLLHGFFENEETAAIFLALWLFSFFILIDFFRWFVFLFFISFLMFNNLLSYNSCFISVLFKFSVFLFVPCIILHFMVFSLFSSFV